VTIDTDCATFIYQQPMNACSAGVLDLHEAKMEAVYKDVMALDILPELASLQKKWQTYADAECEAEGNTVDGGSLEPLIVNECKTQLTNDRIRILEEWTVLVP
jgi:uncharacterized protein YecT (DUF1311 family)